MLAVQPTVELAKRFSQQRVDPLIDESPVLRDKVSPARSRDAGNTVLSKEFPAGILVMTGANSAVGLRSMPVRYLFLDEVDAYPLSADAEGEPVALAEAGTRTYSWRRKVFLASTPRVKGLSRIEREFEASEPRSGGRRWLWPRRSKNRPLVELSLFSELLPVIDAIIKSDRTAPPKQRHSAKRAFAISYSYSATMAWNYSNCRKAVHLANSVAELPFIWHAVYKK